MSMSRMRATRTSQVASEAATSPAAIATDLRAWVATAGGVDRTSRGNGIASEALGAPGEGAGVAVLAGVVEREPEVGVVVAPDDAPRDRQVRPHRVHRVRHLEHGSGGRVAHELDLDLHDPGHLEPTRAVADLVAHRHELHAETPADPRGERFRR